MNILFYLFTTSIATLAIPNENIGTLWTKMRSPNASAYFAANTEQKHQEVYLKDNPCKAFQVTGPDSGRWGGPGLWEILVPGEMVGTRHCVPSCSVPDPSHGGLRPKDGKPRLHLGRGG